ncbi:hypothetical protein [Eubacterium sp.]|uniref:hypothetical protein n=1 Tax=Eubacterium sp. TaxID=142586 RepID=UPI0025FBFDC3|nr:hypothetical protein [Eubacterium sp.]MCR5629077.1 hypothetical protein [Eubacterium sp.]
MDRKKLKQCLSDIGCKEDASEYILRRFESGSMEDTFQLLKRERCRIMDEYHECGKKLDCMDFILRECEKEIKIKNGGV